MLDLENYKKRGSGFIKDIANVSKDQFGKIKEDYEYEKSIREKQAKLDILDDVIYEKISKIREYDEHIAMLEERAQDIKKIMADPKMQISDIVIKKESVQSSETRKNFPDSIIKAVLKRQNHCCKKCGSLLITLDIDHIDGNNSNISIDNCQALCTACHRKKSANQRSKP